MRNGRIDCARTRGVRLGIDLGTVFGTILASLLVGTMPTSAAADAFRIGVRHATVEWTEVDGLVNGYMVYTRRNGEPSAFEAYTVDNRFTVEAAFNDEVIVEVRAVGRLEADGPFVASGFSPPSDPIRFLPAGAFDTRSLALMRSDESTDLRMHAFWSPNSMYRTPGRGAPWVPVAAGFLTHDPLLDVLWENTDSGELEIATIYDPHTTIARSTGSGLPDQDVVGTGDVDGDGDQDLIVHDLRRDQLRIWRLNGAGELRRSTRLPHIEASELADVADFDGDGTAELWVFDEDSDRLRIYAGDGSGPLVDQPIEGHERVARVADFDGDGDQDLLWRTLASGFAMTYLDEAGRSERSVTYPPSAFDAYLDVIGPAPMTPRSELQIVMSSRFDGSLWLMFPNVESYNNRLKVLDGDAEAFEAFEVLY